ncbi:MULTISPECIES: hypothetical protein [unclassified Chryseobacterium]|uniref:hypothetical protein n=1 Tax=unclassified Chryseobacterium TaxID=2593645 RepID=UPI00285360F8|nr:hypothetical protein [Chryseobacterium sp. CFS7]MDR4892270.1 hypothetical protein [Chryseobacterium sp. CFS7]
MADQVNITVTDLIPPANIATIDNTSMQGNAYTKIQVDDKTASITEEFNTKIAEVEQRIETDFKGTIKPTDPAPTEDGSYKPEISSNDDKPTDPNSTADWGKVYPNAGNLRAKTGYNTMFYKKGSVWTRSETKMPEVTVNGVVEASNPNAVSGGSVYDRYKSLINLGSTNIPFTLAAGGINTTTGVPNTSLNWIRTLPITSTGSTAYEATGYGMDSNSSGMRVFFYNGSTFLSYLASGSATTFPFTTPPTCNNYMIQVASGTDVGASPATSPYNSSLKITQGSSAGDYLKAEKLQGTIATPQIQKIETAKATDSNEFSEKFSFTNQVGVIDYKSIAMTGNSSVTHLNFASSNEPDISIIETTVKDIASNGSARLGFGDGNACFQLIKTAASSSVFDVYVMNRYGVTSVGTLSIGTATILKIGDKLRLFRSGLNIIAYLNNVFVGSINLQAQGALSGVLKGIVGFRDNTQYWQADQVRLKKRKTPYLHISVDDSINVFREIATTNPTSIFDNARLAVYKEMHDKYGACFSLFCFYQNSSVTFNLSQMPATWKAEFVANSSWLKIGFHGVDDATDYTTISLTDGVEHYTRIINEINRFAGYSTIDNMPRFSKFKGNKTLYTELKKYGLVGVLAADDTRPDDSGLTTAEQTAVRNGDDYYNYEMGFYFVRTSPRLDLVNAAAVLTMLKTENNNYNTKNVFEMFYHEGRESSTEGREMIEAICKFAYDNRIRFDFPQNNILN